MTNAATKENKIENLSKKMKLDDEKDHMARDDEQKIKMKEDKGVIQKEKEKKDCLRSKVVVPKKNEAKNPPDKKLMCHRRKQD